jgi:hypothetical protein
MTNIEVTGFVLRLLALVAIYAFAGFGLGFLLGILTANTFLVRGKPNVMDEYAEAKKAAAQHNAQWNPSHERWKGADAPGKTEASPEETN